jgi:beta-galactosidase
MDKQLILTRREALQGMAIVSAAAMVPSAVADSTKRSAAPWPDDALSNPDRVREFTADWRFYRGDASGAHAAAFDDSAWRILNVPHDWSIEDLPQSWGKGEGAIWTEGVTPVRTGPFDVYASEGQTANRMGCGRHRLVS